MSSSAKAGASVTPRLKSAVLWGVVGALVFLVLHQAYLLMDGEFLGVGPVAAVAAGVFVATVVASYFTAGHLEVFEPDDSTVEPPYTGAAEPAGETESESKSASQTEPESKPASETQMATETESEPETTSEQESEPETAPEQESESTTGSESAPEPDATEPVADGSLGGGLADEGATDGESDEEAADDSDDEWIWGDQDG